MMKRFLQWKNTRMYHVWLRSFMVCLCLALAGVSAWGQDKNYTFSGGTGTENDPYLISSVEDLKEMVKVKDPTCFKLEQSIVLSEEQWTPLEWINNDDDNVFVFDGAGLSISGLKIDGNQNPNMKYSGLFSIIKYVTIKNLTVEGEIINAEGMVGGICGVNNGATIENCCNNVNIIAVKAVVSEPDYMLVVGGISGIDNGSINKCKNKGKLKISNQSENNDASIFLGGITGMSPGNISECYNIGDLEISNGNDKYANYSLGGICGYINWSTVKNCYNQGVIKDNISQTSGVVYIGGIIGWNQGISYSPFPYGIEYCYNTGNFKLNENSTSKVGGICGWLTDGAKIKSNYYLTQEGINAVGEQAKGTVVENTVDSKDNTAFKNGEVAWLLRQLNEEDRSYVFGQNLNGNLSDEYPKLQCFDETLPAVYQLTLHQNETETIQYCNSGNLNLPEVPGNFGWFDSDGKEYTNTSIIDKDVELWAKGGYKITTGTIENGTITIDPNQTLYQEGTAITVKANPNSDYQLKAGSLQYSYVENGETKTMSIENGSFTMPAADVTITAQFELIPPVTYTITIDPNIQNGRVTSDKAQAAAGETITLTVTPADGYELSELYYMIGTGKTSITGTTFTMPAADVTVHATFTEKEDPTDPEEPVDPPVVDQTNYYNIYNETTYDFIDVSFSRNVVREGGSVNVYLGIPEGLDPEAVTLMFKRGMYNNWETLDEGVQPGEYPINNIWSDIYVKAIVDESYIDPNPDENHIYIDLSETNDSIWLYTDHKLVEEGKTAVIQAEVAKSCQNKEIRYMYKRTVLGEWKEMPKDYSINQYVVRDITTDIYVKAYFVFDKQDPTTAKNPHHVYADITATCEGLYLDATRHKVADEGDTKVFLYVKKGFETKDARYQFKRGLKGEWEDLVPGIEQNTFQVTDIEGDIYLKGIDAVYTGTEDIDGMVRVYTKDGSLFVYTAQPEEISVVSMTGVTVKRTRQTGLQSYPLNQGIYVVCVGEQVFKVRVK